MSAVGKRQLHCFGDDVHGANRVDIMLAFQVKVLQDVQHLRDVTTATAGWRKSDDLVTAIRRNHWLA